MPAIASIARESTTLRELVAGLLGVAIALGCVLPPLIHLVTGPLGPFIGGFVSANQVKPGPRGRVIIGVTIGCGLAAVVGAAAFATIAVSGPNGPPSWFPSSDTLGLIVAVVWLYATVLGLAGATIGASFGRS